MSALVPQPPTKSSNGNKHMKNILLIQSSPRGSESYSQRVADSIVNEIKDRNPSRIVTFRDLAEDPLPHVGPAFISARFANQNSRSNRTRFITSARRPCLWR